MSQPSFADPVCGPDHDDDEMQRLIEAAELADAQYDLDNERVW